MSDDGQRARDPPEILQLRIAADSLSVRHALRLVMRWTAMHLPTEEERGAAEIVLAEVLNNIVEHAYPGGKALAAPLGLAKNRPSGAPHPPPVPAIRLTLAPSVEGLICRVEDCGLAMQGGLPRGRTSPDPALLPEGGFGLELIRALCCQLHYERVGGINQLRFILPVQQSGECDAIV